MLNSLSSAEPQQGPLFLLEEKGGETRRGDQLFHPEFLAVKSERNFPAIDEKGGGGEKGLRDPLENDKTANSCLPHTPKKKKRKRGRSQPGRPYSGQAVPFKHVRRKKKKKSFARIERRAQRSPLQASNMVVYTYKKRERGGWAAPGSVRSWREQTFSKFFQRKKKGRKEKSGAILAESQVFFKAEMEEKKRACFRFLRLKTMRSDRGGREKRKSLGLTLLTLQAL